MLKENWQRALDCIDDLDIIIADKTLSPSYLYIIKGIRERILAILQSSESIH